MNLNNIELGSAAELFDQIGRHPLLLARDCHTVKSHRRFGSIRSLHPQCSVASGVRQEKWRSRTKLKDNGQRTDGRRWDQEGARPEELGLKCVWRKRELLQRDRDSSKWME